MGKRVDQVLVENILHLVAEYYEVQESSILYGNRERRYSEPRHVAMYCLYQFAVMNYLSLARMFGKKSHRTVMYAVEKVREWRYNPKLNMNAANCIQYVKQQTKIN